MPSLTAEATIRKRFQKRTLRGDLPQKVSLLWRSRNSRWVNRPFPKETFEGSPESVPGFLCTDLMRDTAGTAAPDPNCPSYGQ